MQVKGFDAHQVQIPLIYRGFVGSPDCASRARPADGEGPPVPPGALPTLCGRARTCDRPMTAVEPSRLSILLVEDDPGDAVLVQDYLGNAIEFRDDDRPIVDGTGIGPALCRRIVEFHGGEITVEDRPPPGTSIAFVLPRVDGREVLAEVKADPDLRTIPTVVLSTSQAEEDIVGSYDLHADADVSKPVDFEAFVKAVQQIDDFFLSVLRLPRTRP
jgi:CheY-like chemotaxis protein